MQRSVITFVCVIVLSLCGCSFPASPHQQSVQLILLPPADRPDVSLLKQKVTLQSRDMDQQFVVVLRLQPEQLKLVALSAAGQQLFLLDYDGESLTQKNASSIDIPGRDILAIMQFALWPSDSVRQHYIKDKGWFLDISSQQRSLLTSAGLLLKVTYQADVVLIKNHLHDYRLKVQPLEK